mmetsp:Transcript_15053/g.32860  ORF Transcript_15053/g.32860 Transcript_15053/m.32860 type:complete len:436 (+) Transcript_15053:114-1421(+)
MGKRSKRGASLRAKKRADQAHQQLELALTERGEEHRAQSKKDEELFVLDTDRRETAASGKALAAARRAAQKDASKKRKYEHSGREMRQIKRVLEKHGNEGAIALAERGRKRLEGKRVRNLASSAKPTFDLWDESPPPSAGGDEKLRKSSTAAATSFDPDLDPPTQPAAKLSKKQIKARRRAEAEAPPSLAVEVAHPGQSYRPDGEHHQDAVGEALSIEIRRNEAEEHKKRPIGEGMSARTREIIVENDLEEELSDEEEEDSDGNSANATKIIKRKEKLTRAQRNKQKRVKAEQTALKERRLQRQFLHQANEVHGHNKAVKQAEKEQTERRLKTARLKSEKKAQPLGKDVWSALSQKDPIRAPALPVALTEELKSKDGVGGGLRTVTPKGSLVTDRLESMAARNMLSKKKAEGRRVVQGKRRPKARGGRGTEYLLV